MMIEWKTTTIKHDRSLGVTRARRTINQRRETNTGASVHAKLDGIVSDTKLKEEDELGNFMLFG